MGGRSITSSNTSGRLGVCVFLVVSVQSELVTSSTTAPGAGSTAIPDTLKYVSLEIRNKQRKGRKRQKANGYSCIMQKRANSRIRISETRSWQKMLGNILPTPSTGLLRGGADRDFRLLCDRAGGERSFLSPIVQVSECVPLEIHASS